MATGTALTTFLANKLLDHVFRATDYVEPAAVYAALFTVAPGEAGGGTEVTGGSYAREAITFGSAAASSALSNTAACDFGTATADWGTIVAVGIFDALTTGNLLAYGALTANKTVGNGDSFKFAIGDLDLAID
jgi:hypothetical protein